MDERNSADDGIHVQVCYAKPESQILMDLVVKVGTTIEQAVLQSGILEHAPDISLSQNKVGIFGKIKPLDTLLREHDRVEIYRPLAIDPKEARRLRARRQASG